MDIRAQAIASVKWNALSAVVVSVASFITLIALARLLGPAQYGLACMVLVVLGFLQVVSDSGMGNALIAAAKVDNSQLSSLFWFNYGAGILLALALIVFGPLCARLFNQEQLAQFCVLASPVMLLSPTVQILLSLLKKRLMFNALAAIEICEALSFTVTALICAYNGMGVGSIIYGQIVKTVIVLLMAALALRGVWLPTRHFSWPQCRRFISFGLFNTGERIANFLNSNMDYIIIGKLLGPVALGYYALAYQLMSLPLTKINPVFTKVAFPALTLVNSDPARLRRGYLQLTKLIAAITFPLLAGLALVTPEFIGIFYGPAWSPSIVVLPLLCGVGMLKSLGNPSGALLLARSRADISFYWNCGVFVAVVAAVYLGATHNGITGVSGALLLLYALLFFLYLPIIKYLAQCPVALFIKSLGTPVLCTSIMVALLLGIRQMTSFLTTAGSLTLLICAGIVAYAGSLFILDKKYLDELRGLIWNK